MYSFFPTPDGQSVRQHTFRGNIIGFPNAPCSDILVALPMPLKDIPKIMQAIFVMQCDTEKDKDKAFAKATALTIRGQEVVKWARFRSQQVGC